MVRPGMCLPKARTIGSVIEWSPPRQTGRRPLSSNSPTLASIAGKGSLNVNFKSPASQYVPSALRSTPVSVHGFDQLEANATRMIGGAPAEPRNHEELASKGIPRMTGVPGLAASGRCAIGVFLRVQNRLFQACWWSAGRPAQSPRAGRARRPSLRHMTFPLNRSHIAPHPLFYIEPYMATSTRNARGTGTPAILENYERERVFNLFRQWGYLEAELNPLGLLPPQPHPDLQIDNEWALEARRIYCGSVGAEFMHIADPERRRWIQEQLESEPEPVEQELALDLLMQADLFEQTLQQRYLGNKRFSLEGITSLLPLLDEVLDVAGEHGAVELVMGMSHRGRLNVIIHIAKRPP